MVKEHGDAQNLRQDLSLFCLREQLTTQAVMY